MLLQKFSKQVLGVAVVLAVVAVLAGYLLGKNAARQVATAEAAHLAELTKKVAFAFDGTLGGRLEDWSGARLLAETALRLGENAVRLAIVTDRPSSPDYEASPELMPLLEAVRATRKPVQREVRWGGRTYYAVAVPIPADAEGLAHRGVASGDWEVGTVPAAIVVGVDPAVAAPAKRAALFAGILGALLVLLTGGAAVLFAQAPYAQIRRLAAEAETIASGDLDAPISTYSGELGSLAGAIQRLRNGLKATQRG